MERAVSHEVLKPELPFVGMYKDSSLVSVH